MLEIVSWRWSDECIEHLALSTIGRSSELIVYTKLNLCTSYTKSLSHLDSCFIIKSSTCHHVYIHKLSPHLSQPIYPISSLCTTHIISSIYSSCASQSVFGRILAIWLLLFLLLLLLLLLLRHPSHKPAAKGEKYRINTAPSEKHSEIKSDARMEIKEYRS